MHLRTANLVVAIVTLLLGVSALAGSRSLPRWEEGRGLGPGALPVAVGVALVLLALAVALEGRREPQPRAVEWPDRQGCIRVLSVVAGVAAYALLVPRIGFAWSTFLVSAAVLRLISPYSPWVVLGVSLVLGVAFSGVFEHALGVSLPHGAWFN